MKKWIRDLLDDRAVDLDGRSAHVQGHRLAGHPRRLPDLPRKPREESAHGNHPGSRHLVPEALHEALAPGRILLNVAERRGELRPDLGQIGGDLTHAAGKHVEIAVPVEFQLLEQVGDGSARRRVRADVRPR